MGQQKNNRLSAQMMEPGPMRGGSAGTSIRGPESQEGAC
jgi:hypothetical protein